MVILGATFFEIEVEIDIEVEIEVEAVEEVKGSPLLLCVCRVLLGLSVL